MISIKNNYEPYLDWCSLVFKFNDTNYREFVHYMSIYNPSILKNGIIEMDGVIFIDKGNYLKIDLTGEWFKHTKISKDIKQINKFIDWLIKIPTISSLLGDMTINRLDVCCNQYLHTFQSKFLIRSKRKQEITRFYKNNNILTGICVGKRGKQYCWLKVYDKRWDTNKAKLNAVKRFGLFAFLRFEWSLGRKIIKEKKIDFKTNFDDLLDYLYSLKCIDFGDYNKRGKIFHKIKNSLNFDLISQMENQILGICRNHIPQNKRTALCNKIKAL